MSSRSQQSRQGGAGYGSRTVDKALDVLALVAESQDGLSNAEISESLGLDRSTSHRLVATLERRGYVARTPARRFTAGAELRRLAWGAAPDLQLVLQPILRELVELSGESASFSIQSADHFYCVMHLSSPHELIYCPAAGHSYPLNSGAAGFAIWAFLDGANRDRLLASGGFTSFTATTPSTRKELVEELERTRQRGYGVSAGVRTPGGCSIACPAIGGQGTVIGALALSAAELRVPLDELVRYQPDLSRATAGLVTEMKWADANPATVSGGGRP